MGALTEPEIFDCMTSNLRSAIQACEDLARFPRKGHNYDKLRKCLRLIEGTCKQAAAWREDSRWLPLGMMMGQCHQKAGDWLRGIKMPDGTRVKTADGHLHPLFVGLAENLRKGYAVAESFRTGKVNKLGMILPKPLPGPHRDTRPVHVSGYNVRPSGLVIPSAA